MPSQLEVLFLHRAVIQLADFYPKPLYFALHLSPQFDFSTWVAWNLRGEYSIYSCFSSFSCSCIWMQSWNSLPFPLILLYIYYKSTSSIASSIKSCRCIHHPYFYYNQFILSLIIMGFMESLPVAFSLISGQLSVSLGF